MAEPPTDRVLGVRALVQEAAEILPPLWPIQTFIACNPLQGLEHLPFERAVAEAERLYGTAGYPAAAGWREAWAQGRIGRRHLEAGIAAAAPGRQPVLALDGRRLRGADLLRTCVLAALDREEERPGEVALSLARAALEGTTEAPAARSLCAASDARDGGGLGARLDRLTLKWCASFLDEGQAPWPMPGRDRGLLAAWRRLAVRDGALAAAERRALRGLLDGLPEEPAAALAALLRRLALPAADELGYLRAHLVALPGWARYVRWRERADGLGWQRRAPAGTADYLALRVAYDLALSEAATGGARPPVAAAGDLAAEPDEGRVLAVARRVERVARAHGLRAGSPDDLPAEAWHALAAAAAAWPAGTEDRVWLEAAEESYRGPLLAGLKARAQAPAAAGSAAAQIVFCIDVRSEPIRRHLEAQGPYATFGFAGFFGAPIRRLPWAGGESQDLCPVLLAPRHDVGEVAPGDPGGCGGHAVGPRHRRGPAPSLAAAYRRLKGSLLGPFAMVEALGTGFALPLVGSTVAPRRWAAAEAWLAARLGRAPRAVPTVALARAGTADQARHLGIAPAEQALYAEVLLRATGLDPAAGPLIVLCGHGATTRNNPYAAALDCGACGGNPGGFNARVMAAVLNDPGVRTALAERGLPIPAGTVAVAALHDTTTDRVALLDRDAVPASHAAAVAALEADLAAARRANAAERARHLPAAWGLALPAHEQAELRARDWAEVRPEWGLAGNAAFVVAPRALTRGLDLGGRIFLHSYDWAADGEGRILDVILTAPMVVAEWINTQYYFSTVDPRRFGSGSKTTQNVVGRLGVMPGNGGDLATGLPWQSVMEADGRPRHEPLRLLTVVQAPVRRVEDSVRRNPILQRLFRNGWVALAVVDPETGRCLRYGRDGAWREAADSAAPTPAVPNEEAMA